MKAVSRILVWLWPNILGPVWLWPNLLSPVWLRPNILSPVWLWPNLLSLDAPLVAIVWQDLLARSTPSTSLLPAGRLTLGLTVWAIYLADRLLDVRHPDAPGQATPRHRFYQSHRRIALCLLCAAIAADVSVAVLWLRPAVLSNGLWIGTAVACYLALFAFVRIGNERIKQGVAAFLFTAGVFLVAWSFNPRPGKVLLGPALLFYGLVLENLVLIGRWEHGDKATRASLWALAVAVAVLLMGGSHWYAAIALSAAGLAALDYCHLPINARRVLADAVLLTPLFL